MTHLGYLNIRYKEGEYRADSYLMIESYEVKEEAGKYFARYVTRKCWKDDAYASFCDEIYDEYSDPEIDDYEYLFAKEIRSVGDWFEIYKNENDQFYEIDDGEIRILGKVEPKCHYWRRDTEARNDWEQTCNRPVEI